MTRAEALMLDTDFDIQNIGGWWHVIGEESGFYYSIVPEYEVAEELLIDLRSNRI